MFFLSVLLVLPLLAPDAETLPTSESSNQTSRERTRMSRRETPPLPPPYLRLPVFVDSRQPLVEMKHFSPAKGTGKEPLPEPVREVLLPLLSTGKPAVSGSALSVKTSCKTTKMQVQVKRSVLGTGGPQPRIKLGTCRASSSTSDYLYFEYDLDMCGTKRTMKNNQVTYTNVLQYDPPRSQGPIRRAAPFTLPVACYYNRYQYSYKIGYTPKLRMRKIFKPMRNSAKFILTPRNAQWERLSPSDEYVLGQPMYFEAEVASMSQDKRLYIRSCYATPERSHTSTPQFPVVQNFGCMIESKESRSRFIPHKNSAVRFSVDAFSFKGMTGKQLFMHCSMFVGSSTATATAKSCNYDTKAKRWVELYGSDSVCACCDSDCNSAATTVTKIISSKAWTIKPKVKPTKAPRRKAVFTTTTTRAPQAETSAEVTGRRLTLRPEEMAVTRVGKVKNTVRKLDGPIRGGRVVEVEGEEKEVKGAAVVEAKQQQQQQQQEEEEEENVPERHTIFEDIFRFDD